MSDSVGKIGLELDIQSDIQKEIDLMSGKITKSLEGMFADADTSGLTDGLMKGIRSALSGISLSPSPDLTEGISKGVRFGVVQGLADAKPDILAALREVRQASAEGMTGGNPFGGTGGIGWKLPKLDMNDAEVIKAQIASVVQALDLTNTRIAQQQEKLAQLKQSYANTFRENRKVKLADEMYRTEAGILRLINASDQAGFTLATLDDKLLALSTGASEAGKETEETGREAEKAAPKVERLGRATQEAGTQARTGGKGFSLFGGTISRTLSTVMRRMFVYNLMYKGLRGLMSYTTQALGTNEAFASSLAQIRGNLQVAFQPILHAALPALQSLVSWLVVATNVLARFMSALFGMDFADAVAGAKAQAASIKGVGAAAKETRKALAGFDELNVLASPSAGGGGGGGGGAPAIEFPENLKIETVFDDFIERVKEKGILAAWWEDAQELWEKVYGPYFSEIWDEWIVTPAKESWEQIKGWASDAWAWYSDKWSIVWDYIAGFFDKEVWARYGKVISDTWEDVKQWFSDAWEGIKDTFAGVGSWFKEVFSGAWAGIKSAWGSVTAWFTGIWTGIKTAWASVKTWFSNLFTGAWTGIKTAWSGVGSWFSGIWTSIKNAFGAVGTWFQTTFSKAWNAVKDVFSSGGKIFSGIKDGIETTFKTIVNGLISGINTIIRTPFNKINSLLNTIRNVGVMGLKPFQGLWGYSPLTVPQIPKLARGGIIDQPTLAMVGERGREVVMPLENNTGWITDLATKIAGTMQGRQGAVAGAGGDATFQLYLFPGGPMLEEFLYRAQEKRLVRSNGR